MRRGIHLVLASLFTQWAFMLTGFVVAMLLTGTTASAADYSEGSYGRCTYGPCQAITEVETLPDGARVIINLQDGQIIPAGGFLIKITALNGTVSTFKSAAIFIDGVQVAVIEPDETGTASWFWDPKEFPGSDIVITVTALDGTTTTQNYTVKVASETPPAGGSSRGPSRSGGPTQPQNIITKFLDAAVPASVKQVFKKLPPVVINTFPYMLFVVLGLVAVVVLLQVKRELLASRKLTAAVEQQKVMLELKKNFVGLASHYLRTPVTIISGAVEITAKAGAASDGTVNALRAASTKLADDAKVIVRDQESLAPPVSQDLTKSDHTNVRIGIWLAITAIAIGSGIFNLLAYASGRELPSINLITQVCGFVLVSLVLYQIDRRFVLHRRERKIQDDLLKLQQQLQDSQDTFLEQTATSLHADYVELKEVASQIPLDASSKILHSGIATLSEVIEKCQTAKLLKGAYSAQPPTTVKLAEVLDYSEPELTQAINAKQIQIVTPPADKQIRVQEPALLQSVIRSLLDNAVAYSPEKSKVTLEANEDGKQLGLAVHDEGKGISKDRQKLLFQPLSKIEGYEDFSHQGMGFSLYLDKLIMEYMGGSISLESEENMGTHVHLQLPLVV